jgi:hypothetical protein
MQLDIKEGKLTFPALRRIASFVLSSSACCLALVARFSDILARNSSSLCFFSSSVKGLI